MSFKPFSEPAIGSVYSLDLLRFGGSVSSVRSITAVPINEKRYEMEREANEEGESKEGWNRVGIVRTSAFRRLSVA